MGILLRKNATRTTAKIALAAVMAALASMAPTARAELPIEELKLGELAPPDAYRLYLSDPTMPHLVDGRVHVIDGNTMHYLGMLSTGFAGSSTLSRDRKQIFVATTYYSRLQRGTRADVVEAYGTDDLALKYEIEIPTKHVQSLPMKALMGTSSDGRFLFVQNATPATSISVVDLNARKFAGEIAIPGCYGVLPWPSQPRRFSSVCGDGTLATFDLDEQGAVATRSVSEPFFDPDKDPVFIHYQFVGNHLTFVSYLGQVHEVVLDGDKPAFGKTWSLVDAAAAKKGWRPGGYELFAVDSRSGLLYVAMHDKGAEGSHKTPAKEIWIVDMKTQRRTGKLPGAAAISMSIAQGEKSRLFVLSAEENRLLSFDLSSSKPPLRPLARSEPIGETPVYLEMQ